MKNTVKKENNINIAVSESNTPPLKMDSCYHTPLYLDCWWTHLAQRFTITQKSNNWVVHREKRIKDLIPFNVLRLPGWNGIPYQAFDKKAYQHFLEAEKEMSWHFVQLNWAESYKHEQCFDLLDNKIVLHQPAGYEYWIDLEGGLENYLKGLSKNSRRDYKKKMKALDNLSVRLESLPTDENSIEGFFEQFIPLHQQYWLEKNGFSYLSDKDEQRFAVEWAKILSQDSEVLLTALYIDDTLSCLNMGYVQGQTFNLILTIQTGENKQYFPGLINLFKTLEFAIEKGYRYCNQSTGDYTYKQQFSTYKEPLWTTTIINPKSLRGRLYGEWLKRKLSN